MSIRSLHKILMTAGMAAASLCALPAHALEWGVAAGTASNHGVKKVSVIAGWDRQAPLWQGDKWHLDLHHEVELGYWHVPEASDIVEFGYSPFLRMARPTQGGGSFFVEASVGVRGLSHVRIAPTKTMSTAFQFSDQLGMGYQWGSQQQNTVGVRVQHESNASIKTPNPGINFGLLYYQRKFQ
ncbi:acyloxyacyl hydrolase [Brachymonas sp.]|uniref:acyloxyacyl hydrolase n=1 Tax=Brachymonas sp. TaxID=1936292 RepID=UPI0035B4F888